MTVYVVMVLKGADVYVWRFDRDHVVDIMQAIGKTAADPGLSFTWADAAKTCKRIRERMSCSF